MLGVAFSIDETTMRLKGQRVDKRGKCTNQKVMYNIHMIFVIKDTHNKTFMYNDPSPKTYLAKRMLPIHARMMAFLILWRKNTINAQWIISKTQTHFSRQRTIIGKITDSCCYKKGKIGIPSRVTQEELKSKEAQIEANRTSKEAVTEGVTKLTNLIEASMCDTTHVYYTSMVSEESK